jgi:hypothetical protein
MKNVSFTLKIAAAGIILALPSIMLAQPHRAKPRPPVIHLPVFRSTSKQ